MPRYRSINDIANQVAVEVGLAPATDVFGSSDPAFAQLTTLANACGVELLQDTPWQGLRREHQITTSSLDSGEYDLPSDFAYMINQTGWDRTNSIPLGGPLSGQAWQYLLGRDLVTSTIYASFRLAENEFWIFPRPPPDGLDIRFEYISRNWVLENGVADQYAEEVLNPGDVILYPSYLFERLLKKRFLEARGFDSSTATDQFRNALLAWAAHDKTAPVLNAGRGPGVDRLLNTFCNTPDTGYGV